MKMTFLGAVKAGLQKAFVFRGTATRREFWFFFLFRVLVGIVAFQLDQLFFMPGNAVPGENPQAEAGFLSTTLAVLLLIPSLSVNVRRIRDAGWSGKWMLLWIFPILTLFWTAMSFASYLNSVAAPDQESVNQIFAQTLAPFILITAAVQIFLLVLCLLPSKPKDQGNKYAVEG